MKARFALLLLSCAASTALAKERLVVLPLSAEPSLEKLAAAAGELVMTEVQRDGRYEVLGTSDLQTLLGLERQRQLMGCSDESGNCMAELSGALGAPYVLTGSITKVAEGLRIDLKLMQADRAAVLAREGGIAPSEGEVVSTTGRLVSDLLLQLPGAKVSALGKRLPLIAGGAGALISLAGVVLLADQGVKTGSLQGQLNTSAVTATEASQRIGGIYAERGAGVTLVTLGVLVMAACLVWWWLQ